MMMVEVCRRSDHPARRPHWHYGPAGRYWCTDPNLPLTDDSDGRLYVKEGAE